MKTSIIILTRNQFHLTVLCLESIRKYTPQPYEIIVVDNGSTDLTTTYLKIQLDITLICNEDNAGFAAGCNQGLAAATGDNILFLNNDTVVTPHWLTSMLEVLYSSPDIGMVGPLTNYSSGHQIIPVTYTDLLDLNQFAHEHAARYQGSTTEVRRLIGFCMLVRRKVLDEVGGFDELYGLGNFEDDDLCLRVAHAGYRLFIANASFIHHVGHATMNDIKKDNVQHLMAINRHRAQEKWGADIFDLIYKEDIRLTCCVLATSKCAATTLTLDSIKDIADEVVLIDQQGECADVLESYVGKYVEGHSERNKIKLWKLGIEQAAGPYLLLIEAGEYISDEDRRQLRVLKRSIMPEVAAVLMKCEYNGILNDSYQVRLFHSSFPFPYLDDLSLHDREVLESEIEVKHVLTKTYDTGIPT
ncbi:glycosyltransferase family 2 protein [Paenibacillus sp. ACRRX]|uniref:glycosyltransferase family 2 protein n=1 Tax=Paenibacillus sp. ACRRX TaxID=2918206 RepID=UPI001EF40105|nr:glycosyltransferase family 2 protein [Paenibacillus sp. ACRRX]MCG7410881.1 glycosyltransferase family 2 protein [Paenibacillus sp. ACRRX]